MLDPATQDQLARDEAAYLAKRAQARKKRRAIGVVLLVLGVACGGIMAIDLATGGDRSIARLAPLGAALFMIIAGLDRMR